MAYKAATVQAAWDNHFAAFGAQDVDKIMLDYTEKSVLKAWEHTEGKLTTATGVKEIREFFVNLFALLSDASGLTAPVIEVAEKQVYLVWTCPTSGVQSATDSFIFADDNTISWQNIAWAKGSAANAYKDVTAATPAAPAALVAMDGAYSKATVQAAWDNHFAAFGGQDVKAIMQDYSEKSVLKAFDHTTGTLTAATGLAQIQAFFEGLFATLSDTSKLAAPVTHHTEDPKQVYLIWSCPSSGITSATDTFIHGADNKIIRQNIAFTSYKAPTVQAAWDNHFAAFGGQEVGKIMLDYTDKSVLKAWEHTEGKLTTATGRKEIREFFVNLFSLLSDTSGLTAPVIDVTEKQELEEKQVFLVWTCPTSGVQSATDTFIFADDNTIAWQNIAWAKGKDPNAYKDVTQAASEAAVSPVPIDKKGRFSVQAAWDNHFAGFGGQDVKLIMQDYVEQSVLKAFDHSSGTLTTATGLAQIQTFFEGLFKTLSDTSKLAAPVIEPCEDPRQVYLIWNCTSSGITSATDSFILNSANRIIRQNIAFTSSK